MTVDAPKAVDPVLKAVAAGRDHCISMAWHGSIKDLAYVLIVSGGLVKETRPTAPELRPRLKRLSRERQEG